MAEDIARLAVIEFAQDEAVDDLLHRVARSLQANDIKVAGFVQQAEKVDGQCCGAVTVEDISTGRQWQVMQPLGRHSKGCRLDPQALAEVSAAALAQLEQGAEIVILNRFGKGEADGAGLRAVFEAACLAGVPVLTSVKETYVAAWQTFAGELSVSLKADAGEVLGWCLEAIGKTGMIRDAA